VEAVKEVQDVPPIAPEQGHDAFLHAWKMGARRDAWPRYPSTCSLDSALTCSNFEPSPACS
ncbi:hypothetical protein HAX54_051463, partial [Datura stramonium]|nr:hypothetical protein [Datura stramonium]